MCSLSWDLSLAYWNQYLRHHRRIAILVNRGIEDHSRSDLGAIGGGCRQAAVIGVLENHSRLTMESRPGHELEGNDVEALL